MKLISVIVPIYNQEKYLERCVDSILRQTYSNLEIILIDDGSTDKSGEICEAYLRKDTRIQVVHKKNGGLSSARNAGIKVARGEYIGFVDSDDFIAEDMYQILMEHCLRYDNISVFQIRLAHVSAENGVEKLEQDGGIVCIEQKEYFKQLLLHIGDCSFCTKIFKKECFDTLRFNEKLLNEDFELLLKMINDNILQKLGMINTVGYYCWFRSGSITNSGYSKAIVDSIYNSDLAMSIVVKKYPDLTKIAERFCLIQRIQFMTRIPIQLMSGENKDYCKVISEIKSWRLKMLFNPYLSLIEKRNILLYSIAPIKIKKFSKWLKGIRL